MIKVPTIGTVCGNRIESLFYRPQGLDFNDCLVALHHPRLSLPPSAPDSFEGVAMSSHPLNRSPEDQFLHWCQEMEKKQKEQAR